MSYEFYLTFDKNPAYWNILKSQERLYFAPLIFSQQTHLRYRLCYFPVTEIVYLLSCKMKTYISCILNTDTEPLLEQRNR